MSILLRMLISVVLALPACWATVYNWRLPPPGGHHYTYSDEEAHRLRFYPRVQFAEGMHAWLQQNPARAAGFFRQAVAQNVLYPDAWLKLAEAEAAVGRKATARKMFTFTTAMTGHAMRWQWSQLLLADELGMDTSFDRLANELLSRKDMAQDTLQLLHTRFNGDASAVVAVLNPAHLTAYLDWLIRWGMTRESLTVWHALTSGAGAQKQTALRYADFLLNRKRIVLARDIWRQYTGVSGLSKPAWGLIGTKMVGRTTTGNSNGSIPAPSKAISRCGSPSEDRQTFPSSTSIRFSRQRRLRDTASAMPGNAEASQPIRDRSWKFSATTNPVSTGRDR